ncbi:MAG: ABC transporter ATP-binding protein [Desulfobacteraceae bacterium]|nr:MAG: ABC transporter ATP-binding protein [Desulfobacteraceae bacterium]
MIERVSLSDKVVIDVDCVTRTFKNVTAVDNLCLQLHAGEFIALLGPNGAGKTTLVEMIEGIQKPDQGEIVIMGQRWSRNNSALQRVFGIALQETRFVDRLTVRETLDLFGSFYGLPRSRSTEVIAQVGLEEKSRVYAMNLSGGQRQRLALAIALLNEPPIMILDEPTTGLDPNARREIWKILQDLKAHDTTLILTTHYMEEAQILCDRILIMDHGKIIGQGTLAELLAAHNSHEIITFKTDIEPPLDLLAALPGYITFSWDPENRKGLLQVSDIVTALPPLLKKLQQKNRRIEELECRRMNLDDLFILLTGRRLHEEQ